MEHDIQLIFQLLDTEVSPKDITDILGITPDKQFSKGERNKKLGLPKQNIWSLRSHAKSDDLSDHWNDIKLDLINMKSEIKKISETGFPKFTILINSSERVPPIIIPSDLLLFAGEIGAEINIDHLQQ